MTTRIRDEARALGSLGPAALGMMTRVFEQELQRFPGLAATDAPEDLVNSFFLDKREGYANAVVAAIDDSAAEKLTRAWGRNWLVDRARALPFGALRNRLEKRLNRSPVFARSAVAHYWFLADGDDADRPTTDEELKQVASAARVEVLHLPNGQGVRLGHPGQLEELLRRLLLAAGRLHVSTITSICAERFPSSMDPTDASLAVADVDWDYVEETTEVHNTIGSTGSRLSDEQSAQAIWDALTDQERIAIRFIDDAPALAARLGIGRRSAYSLTKRLRAKLVELAGDGERGREVLAVLIELMLDDHAVVPFLDSEEREDIGAI